MIPTPAAEQGPGSAGAPLLRVDNIDDKGGVFTSGDARFSGSILATGTSAKAVGAAVP